MQAKVGKIKITLLFWLFLLLIITLAIMSSCLYVNNTIYRRQNRVLIIQNDSIISVNIDLARELQLYKRTTLVKTGNKTE